MKHRLKNSKPSTSPRLAVTITLTIIAGGLAALTIITSDLASTAIPETLKPYVPYSWPILPVLLLLGIVVAVWQVWYSRNRSTNNGASVAQAAAQGNNAPSIAAPAIQPALPSSLSATPAATTPSQPAQQTPASGATTAPSVSPAPIPTTAHYHTCVISYSDKNALFVNKLYNDLKALGVPCLLVEQDLKIGDKLRKEIYQAIRQLDKLLLVLSQDAIESKWVEEAVDVALDRESQQPGTYLLFPLRLDDAVLTTEKYWAIAVRQRLIGDFRHWQQDAAYQQALQRVLRDLQV